MKFICLPLLILIGFSGKSQADKFKINVDITLGLVNYHFDEIESGISSFSNYSWIDTVYSQKYSHEGYYYSGLNTVLHAGFHIPIVKGKTVSVGIRPKVGIGRLFQVSPKPSKYTDTYGWGDGDDPRRITSGTADATLLAYLRYNLYPKHLTRDHVTMLLGYRFIRSKDNYHTPIIQVEYGQEFWAIGAYAHLFRIDYLREFSNGSTETAKSIHEFGVTFNLFLKSRSLKNPNK